MRPPKLALRMAAAGLAVAATLALGVAGAAAAPNPNPGTDGPQTANVPTLAWVGEKVRLVACDSSIDSSSNASSNYQEADWNTELWTGDQAYQSTPVFDGSLLASVNNASTSGANDFFTPSNSENSGKGCTATDITSLHAGLWEGELDVFDASRHSVYSEQFIVIWMTANAPTLTEASVDTQAPGINSLANPGSPGTDAPPTTFSQLSPLGLINATSYLGDPTGNGMFTPDWFGYGQDPNGCVSKGPIGHDGQGEMYDSANNDDAGCNDGLVDIRVTGSFPIEDQPPATTNVSYFGATSFTLPRDWAKLAGILADSSTQGSNPGSNPSLWDIHGGPTNAFPADHVGNSTGVCANDTGSVFSTTSSPAFTETLDSVDDCTYNTPSNYLAKYFSRVFGDLTSGTTATIGPYDDEFPNETLISDGMLNSDDAPMPALPVTVSIAGNTGGSDIGGVGGLYSASKQLIYSHDFNGNDARTLPSVVGGTPNTGGNLYNPYYKEFIPSTERGTSSSSQYNEDSGITGVYGGGDDFPGFDNGDTDPYTFWKAEDVGSVDTGGATACLQRTWDSLGGPPPDPKWFQLSNYYQNPDYPTSVTVYTDERGEAYVVYNPGNEFYFNNLIAGNQISVDNNGACDLQPLLGKALGTSVISAQVSYPYKAVPYKAPLSSNSLTKTVTSEWSKTLTAYPKLNAGSGTYSPDDSIFIAKANDIGGEPFVGETVCFSVQATQALPGVNVFYGQVQNTAHAVLADTGAGTDPWEIGSYPADEPKGASNYTCATTNYLGEAGIEIAGSIPSVDVTAWFVNEHLFRDVTTTLGDPTPVTSSSAPTTLPADPIVQSTGNSGSNGGSSSSSNAITSTPGNDVTTVTPLAVAKAATVEFARLARGKKGNSVTLDVSSAAKTQTITINVYAHGKLVRRYHLTVKTNKLVKVNIGHGLIGRIKVVL